MSTNPYAPPAASLELAPAPVTGPPALWNPNAAGLWSILLNPVFGSILVWRNWQALGDRFHARIALIWLGLSVLVFWIAMTTAASLNVPFLVIWYFACQRPQAVYVKKAWGDDYPRKPWAVPLLVAFGLLAGLIVLFSYVVPY